MWIASIRWRDAMCAMVFLHDTASRTRGRRLRAMTSVGVCPCRSLLGVAMATLRIAAGGRIACFMTCMPFIRGRHRIGRFSRWASLSGAMTCVGLCRRRYGDC